jgi:putative endonuclease
MPTSVLPSTRERGLAAEEVAARYLLDTGHHILKRNLSTRYGEIDILAKKNGEFIAVEVRSHRRDTPIPPELSVSVTKYRHLVRTLLSLPFLHNQPTRIDLVTVVKGQVRRHYRSIDPTRGAYA